MENSSHDPLITAALRLHAGLARQGPGSTATTLRLLELAGPLPRRPRLLDLGCGPGAATVPLATTTGGHVTAVDIHQPFLDELRARATAAGVGDRVTVRRCSMDELPFAASSFDVIHCEGAVYSIGFDTALRLWRRLLAPEGVLIVTECCWTSAAPAPEAQRHWDELYPLRTVGRNADAAMEAGYQVIATYRVPDHEWYDEYYTPLWQRTERIDPNDPHAVEAARRLRREIDVHRAHSADFGYVGYVLRPR